MYMNRGVVQNLWFIYAMWKYIKIYYETKSACDEQMSIIHSHNTSIQ